MNSGTINLIRFIEESGGLGIPFRPGTTFTRRPWYVSSLSFPLLSNFVFSYVLHDIRKLGLRSHKIILKSTYRDRNMLRYALHCLGSAHKDSARYQINKLALHVSFRDLGSVVTEVSGPATSSIMHPLFTR